MYSVLGFGSNGSQCLDLHRFVDGQVEVTKDGGNNHFHLVHCKLLANAVSVEGNKNVKTQKCLIMMSKQIIMISKNIIMSKNNYYV